MERKPIDRGQAEAVGDALLEQGQRRQHAVRNRRLRLRWRREAMAWRNRRALALAVVAVLLAAVLAGIVGVRTWQQLMTFAGWKPLLLWIGLPAFALGVWLLRTPPERDGIEEL